MLSVGSGDMNSSPSAGPPSPVSTELSPSPARLVLIVEPGHGSDKQARPLLEASVPLSQARTVDPLSMTAVGVRASRIHPLPCLNGPRGDRPQMRPPEPLRPLRSLLQQYTPGSRGQAKAIRWDPLSSLASEEVSMEPPELNSSKALQGHPAVSPPQSQADLQPRRDQIHSLSSSGK